MHGVAPFPLYWPLENPRTKSRGNAAFKVDFVTARTGLLGELQRLQARDIVISSNVPIRRDGLPAVPDREPQDPGVAVYFRRKDRPYVIACDHFLKVRWNLRAIGETIKALRSIERYGSTSMLDQAFSGFAQLPGAPATAPTSWRTVLGIPDGPVDRARIEERYRALALLLHPDRGGDTTAMASLNVARDQALRETRL
jgi:hypothetical protein